ncbi:DUF6233 domain-containing protein [Streptomyces sp. NPDC005899]|uniref:DUF6233 domain-containing protein n=1 Tax=Streptomyces sp. NPDC005899 TaxID=3155716 RepID=UPI0033FCE47C
MGIGQGRPPIEVHYSGRCHAAGRWRRSIDRNQARALLSDGVRACDNCRPDIRRGLTAAAYRSGEITAAGSVAARYACAVSRNAERAWSMKAR